MIVAEHIKAENLTERILTSPWASQPSAGVIFGASGGVMSGASFRLLGGGE